MSAGGSAFMDALARRPAGRVPLWMMRQAGRYLPEYRALRAEAGSFLALCRTPELACRATLQPIERFGLDAAILFSDILVVPDALGCGLAFTDGEGPRLESPVRSEGDVDGLGRLDPADLSYQAEAVRLCKRELGGRAPLIAFAGAPFTLACYAVDGSGGEFLEARAMMRGNPEAFGRLVGKLSDAVSSCLLAQAEAGADALMVFDSWAGLVPRDMADGLLEAPLKRIVSEIRESGCGVPLIAFWRNASDLAEMAVETGVDALGIDWRSDFGELSARVGDKVALQGNLDPATLLAGGEAVRREALRILRSHRRAAGHVFNLGHGIHKDTPIESVEVLVETVSGYSPGDG